MRLAIYRLLQNSAFEPDDVKRTCDAYEAALVELCLADRNDPLTEMIAKYIVEIAQTGEKDASVICKLVLSE